MDSIDNTDIFKIHADFCSTMANERRLRIMWLLGQKECSVNEIAERLDIPRPNVSQNLRVLRDKGAVMERKQGQQVLYKIANEKFMKGCRLIREGLIEALEMRSSMFTNDKNS